MWTCRVLLLPCVSLAWWFQGVQSSQEEQHDVSVQSSSLSRPRHILWWVWNHQELRAGSTGRCSGCDHKWRWAPPVHCAHGNNNTPSEKIFWVDFKNHNIFETILKSFYPIKQLSFVQFEVLGSFRLMMSFSYILWRRIWLRCYHPWLSFLLGAAVVRSNPAVRLFLSKFSLCLTQSAFLLSLSLPLSLSCLS